MPRPSASADDRLARRRLARATDNIKVRVGAENLFDAFASLPGMNTNTLVAALEPTPATGSTALNLAAETRTIWHRKDKAVLSGG